MAQKLFKFKIDAGAFYIPKGKPGRPLGEDAHFFSEEAQVIGVADGVGSWAKKGIDAGEYARQLMSHADDAVKDLHPEKVDPKEILVKASRNTEADGSTTACIISVSGQRLRAANLGDSGFLVIREGETIYKTKAQQHKFNHPYQIGKGNGSTSPDQAEEIVMDLEDGDVIVAGTDGLLDNLFEEEIEKEVRMCTMLRARPGLAARELAMEARRKSCRRDLLSPFQRAAKEAGLVHFGGKFDDITVVVAYVSCSGFI